MGMDMRSIDLGQDAQTVSIGRFHVKRPMRVAPAQNTRYWCTDLSDRGLSLGFVWCGSAADFERLGSGRCHALQADADLHGAALLSFTRTDDT